ncbi:myb-like protein X [Melanaphis sacchari]|uniref:myb-like protein X n=1 Tax=Melanaphis sacchari TaxID=742174 RepID=UPI000DC15420|nr:myb-like protein X [Melanaphis sacchari]XP_025198871.1 myb-like protein X [Melanaphis sacchari]XP_025198873.1 myb-like protein X [Melanaphis sacchari]
MSAFDGIIAAAIETTNSQIVLTLLVVVIYVFTVFYLIWAAASAELRRRSTGYRRGNVAEVKTSQSKPKKSTSTAVVQLKNKNIKNTNTARLQICESIMPKSDTIVHNIKAELNQKVEHQMEEDNFITVLSKRERQRIHRKKQQEKKEKEQQLEEKQTNVNKNQSNQRQRDKPLQQRIVTPAINKNTNTLSKSSKTVVVLNEQPSLQSYQINDRKSKKYNVKITKKRLSVENDSSANSLQTNSDKVLNAERDIQLKKLQAKHSTKTNASYANLENLKQAVSQNVVTEMTRIEECIPNRDSVKNNEKLCKEHDTIIKDLRKENENMRMQYESSMKNNWTDNEFKIVLEGVRAEIEMKGLDAIKKLLEDHQVMLEELKMKHDLEIKDLHTYYHLLLNDLQIKHDRMVKDIHLRHDMLINGFRNFNFEQSQRYEAAMQNMRQVKNKMSKEHQDEVRGLRENYENTIKDHEIATKHLLEEKELLRAEHEKVVQKLHKINGDRHHTIIEACQQIANDCNDNDADTRTTTTADNDTKQIFYDTEQKLIQLHGYTSSNDSDCSTQDLL